MRRAFVCASICLAGVASTGLLWLARGKTDQEQLAVNQVLGLLSERRPSAYDEESWGRLVAVVGEVLAERNVNALSRHHADMIAHTLELHAAEELPSQEKDAFEVEWLRWALPQFLADPPSESETAQLVQQIDQLARWVAAQMVHPGPDEPDRESGEQLRRWSAHAADLATSFRMGSGLHPLTEDDVAAAKLAFHTRYTEEAGKGRSPGSVNTAACAACLNEVISRAARPPLRPLPPSLLELQKAVVAGIKRDMHRDILAMEARFHERVIADQLSVEREDLEAWTLLLDVAQVETLVRGPRPWHCLSEIAVGTRVPAPIRTALTPGGSVVLRTPWVADASRSKWRWENREIEVDAERVYLRQGPQDTQTWVPLRAPPPAELVHFTEQDWAQALAAQATASRLFWQALAPYLWRPQGDTDGERTGVTDLGSPIGLVPFLATPAVQRLERRKPGEAVRLLSADAQEVGSVACEYGFRQDALGATPSVVALQLAPRTVMAGATMLAKHEASQAATEERWSAPIPAEVRKVVFRLAASAPAAPALESIVASDEKGQTLCKITVSDLGDD